MKKKAMQIYLLEDQIQTLRVVAERRGESMAALVRQGVDMLLDSLPADEDPLLDIIGLYDSGRGDLAENHDPTLVQLIQEAFTFDRHFAAVGLQMLPGKGDEGMPSK